MRAASTQRRGAESDAGGRVSTVAWSCEQLPDLSGKRALVTGAASGLGLETALGLAARGANVLLADRNLEGGAAALARLRSELPAARAELLPLDLADLSMVGRFADELNMRQEPLDILVNNAGILPPLQRRTTVDGFEMKFGINVLGHFALNGRLLPSLLKSSAARVVWVSSLVHRHARIDFNDLQSESNYAHQRVYNQAKLACLVLALEMQRRCAAAGVGIVSLAAHPGVARTALGASRNGQVRRTLVDHIADFGLWAALKFFGQDPDRGARSMLWAAAAEGVEGGQFFGPRGIGEMSGDPVRVQASAPALDSAQAGRLWSMCEQLTGVSYGALQRDRGVKE